MMTDSELDYDSYLAPSPLPPIDAEQRAAAKQQPGTQFKYYDPGMHPQGLKAGSSVQGWRYVDADGNFTGQDVPNPEYSPHPDTLGFMPMSAFEMTLWRTANGYHRVLTLVSGLFAVELIAKGSARGDNELHLEPGEDGVLTLDVYSTKDKLPQDWPHWVPIAGEDLVLVLGRGADLMIQFNRGAESALRVPARLLGKAYDNGSRDGKRDRLADLPLPAEPTTMGTAQGIGAQR
ncbi:hypothetical protein ABZ345_41805 [Lentzea sp. NPDC005914]|uniref:hypothetical protein n=1 Tax=Lentzea sp. NPDC005914 TaxID=3154572 RepID=UPI0033E5BAE9